MVTCDLQHRCLVKAARSPQTIIHVCSISEESYGTFGLFSEAVNLRVSLIPFKLFMQSKFTVDNHILEVGGGGGDSLK